MQASSMREDGYLSAAVRGALGRWRALWRRSLPEVAPILTPPDVASPCPQELEPPASTGLEIVGRLAPGIAHEINTPVQFVGDNLRFMVQTYEQVRQLRCDYRALLVEHVPADRLAAIVERERQIEIDYLDREVPLALYQSLEGIDRVATIVQSFKSFGRGTDTPQRRTVDLNRMLWNALIVARNEIKYVADVNTDFGELPPFTCWVDEMGQVLLHLLVEVASGLAEGSRRGDGRGVIRVHTRCDGAAVTVTIGCSGGCSRGGCSGAGCSGEAASGVVMPPVAGAPAHGILALARMVVVGRHGGELLCETGTAGDGMTFRLTMPIDRCDDDEGHAA